jgi:hypothetical protein
MSVSGPSRRYHRRTYLVTIGAIADMPGARARRCLRSLTACFAVYTAGTQPFKPLRSFHAGQRRDSLGNVQILLASEVLESNRVPLPSGVTATTGLLR